MSTKTMFTEWTGDESYGLRLIAFRVHHAAALGKFDMQ